MTSSDQPLMTIVIPAYNEAHRLPQTLTRVMDFVASRSETLDIIVVNNNSRDNTHPVAEAIAKDVSFLLVLD